MHTFQIHSKYIKITRATIYKEKFKFRIASLNSEAETLLFISRGEDEHLASSILAIYQSSMKNTNDHPTSDPFK